MRFSSRISDQRMNSVRKKLRMNRFLHTEFDPNLLFSSAAPILDRVFKAADSEYDENTEKGNQYIMDYILDSMTQKEMKELCKEITQIQVSQIPKL
jgi:hypothetical protein